MAKKTVIPSNGKPKNLITAYSKEELGEFETLILEKKAETEASINQLKTVTSAPVNEKNGGNLMPDNMAELGTDTNEREKDSFSLYRLERYMLELNNALIRIKNGAFGLDASTGEKISKARLLAVPTTKRTISNKLAKATN